VASTRTQNKLLRFVWVSAWYGFAAVVVLLATLFAGARLLLPYAEQYNAEVGERLSNYLKQPVLVRSLDAEWHGWGPSLVLRDAALLDSSGEHPVLQLEKVRLGLDLLASLRRWQPVFSNITLVGLDLNITRTRDGAFLAEGLGVQDSGTGGDASAASPFLAWLFSQGRLALEQSNIHWRDEMSGGRRLQFSAVNVSLRNDGERHQLDASLNLSRRLGKSLVLRVDMQGNPLRAQGRRTRMYLAGEHVHLAKLFEPQTLAGVRLSVKSASFALWAQWRSGDLQDLAGNVEAAGVMLEAAEQNDGQLALDRVAGDFRWRQENDGWQFDANELQLARKSRQWQPSRVALNFRQSQKEPLLIDAYASFLQLEDITQVLRLFSVGGKALQEPLFAIGPRGELRDARLSWRAGEVYDYAAYARLRNIAVNAWRAVPEAQAVDGQLWLGSQHGQIQLQHAALTLDFPDLFRWPLTVNEMRGNLAWQQEGDYWQVIGRQLEAANDDIKTSGSIDIVHDGAEKSPFMSLMVNFHDGDGSQVAGYLPTGIMPESAVDWLDEAIVDARIVSGGALFHGRLADFPFDRGDGRFEVRFVAENASLNYARDWPPVTGITADVRFNGRGMSVLGKQGRIFSNQIQWARVDIADMTATPMLLEIRGEVQGSTQEKLNYLIQSPPLYRAFARHLEGMTAQGDSLLNLDVRLPIGGDDPLQVSGWVEMQDNGLAIDPLGPVLSNVDGRLKFFEKGLSADRIQADLFGQTTQITINTDETAENPKVRIHAEGMFEAQDLAARYLPPVRELLSGSGDWDVSFSIPLEAEGKEIPQSVRHAVLQVRSNLKGVAARLPPPFDKTAEEPGSLEVRVDFPTKLPPVLRLNYEGFVDGVFVLGDWVDDPATADADILANSFRGEVRLNGGAAQLPQAPGLRVSGWLDKVSLDDWRSLRLTSASDDNGTALFNAADVAVRELEAYGQQFHNARLKLARWDEGLQADIDSKELKGRILLPDNLQTNPLQVDLAKCYLTGMADTGGVLDPRDIPGLDVRIADFRYKKRHLGAVRLETARVADGLRIEQLVVKPRSTTITTRGGWYIRGADQKSHVQVHVESNNIGHTLRALDYVGGIDKGKGKVNLELQWPGSFFDVNAENILGRMSLSLRDGYLLDVDPGAGRMFGLLSIQTLPRRLLLDFSDVFKKGFGFDVIKGSFTIEDGDAYTNDLYMDGPAARVDISGRIGLAQQDYDQLVTVTPHVAESLPVIGALAATPQIGAAILAIQKLFQPAIDDVARNQYTITGSWNAPVIKKLRPDNTIVDDSDKDGGDIEEP